MIEFKEFLSALKTQLKAWGINESDRKRFIDGLSKDYSIAPNNAIATVFKHLVAFDVPKKEASEFCDNLVDSMIDICGVYKVHEKKNRVNVVKNKLTKNPVNFYYKIGDIAMRRADFAQIKKFLKLMRCKRGEFLVVDLVSDDHFGNIKFIQTCRLEDGGYRIEAGVKIDGENSVFRMPVHADYKTVVKEFKDVCVDLQRPYYQEWDDVSEEIFGDRHGVRAQDSTSLELDDDTTMNFYIEQSE